MKNNSFSHEHNFPLVSVVMASYNNAENVMKTLHSIHQQDYPNIELILIDDGSTDKTAELIEQFLAHHECNAQWVTNPTNIGLTKSLMLGCDLAKGKYIARHDCGDTSSSNRIRLQVDFLENNHDFALAFTAYTLCEIVFNKPLLTIQEKETDTLNINHVDSITSIECPSHHGSALFTREIYQKVGGYRAAFYYAQDIDLWLRIAQQKKVKVINEAQYVATFSPKDISARAIDEQNQLKALAINCLKNPHHTRQNLIKAAEIKPVMSYQKQASQEMPHQEMAQKSKESLKNERKANYFIASCLLEQNYRKEARHYLVKNLPHMLTSPKMMAKLLKSFL